MGYVRVDRVTLVGLRFRGPDGVRVQGEDEFEELQLYGRTKTMAQNPFPMAIQNQTAPN